MAGPKRQLPRGATASCDDDGPHGRHLWGTDHPIACPGVEPVAELRQAVSGMVAEPGDVLLLGVGDVRIARDQAEALRAAVLGACPGLADVLFLPVAGTVVYRAPR
jgi:hypothetical protein